MFKIGDRHTKISVSTWNQEVRVHLWKFHQSCFDRNKFYPTKKGIALTIKEWQDLKALVSQVDEVIGCTNAMLKLEDDEEITVQDAVEARTSRVEYQRQFGQEVVRTINFPFLP